MDTKDYFFCYNPELSSHLVRSGYMYITKAKTPSTDKVFWLFKSTDSLSREIIKFKRSRKSGK